MAAGYLMFHEPQPRNVIDNFQAVNVEAAINAATGWLIITTLIIGVRSAVFLVLGSMTNLARRRFRRLLGLWALVLAKLPLAWAIYLLLFLYGRQYGFTRILWNLQDLGLQVDVSAVLAIGVFNAVCILVLPDLLLGLVSGKHEAALVLPARSGRNPA